MAVEIAVGVLVASAVGMMGFVAWLIVCDDDQPGVG